MINTRSIGILLLAALSAASLAAEPAAESPSEALARLLDGSRSALTVTEKGLSGPGAAKLLDATRAAQFVLIGEDHGFIEVPQFVLALKRSLAADAPANLVLEVGPLSAAKLADASRKNELTRLATDYPAAIPFFGWKDDAAMAKAWQGADRSARLWGIDQEFLLSTRLHAERLKVLNPRGAAGEAAAAFASRALASETAMNERHDPSTLLLPQLEAEDFAMLRAAIKPAAGSESASILDELAESAEVYRGQSGDGLASNQQRSLMMKRHFMAYYDAASKKDGVAPRALFRLGAFHAGRGRSPTNQFDIGNLASELAASRGRRSVHVLVLVAGGTVNKWFPLSADTSLRNAAYDAKEELAVLDAAPYLEHAFATGWTVFDLSTLRTSRAARQSAGAMFDRIAFDYDYVVMVAQGHAAVELAQQ